MTVTISSSLILTDINCKPETPYTLCKFVNSSDRSMHICMTITYHFTLCDSSPLKGCCSLTFMAPTPTTLTYIYSFIHSFNHSLTTTFRCRNFSSTKGSLNQQHLFDKISNNKITFTFYVNLFMLNFFCSKDVQIYSHWSTDHSLRSIDFPPELHSHF